ncbi:hypothetical protein HJ015_23530, partial [Vibrio parahaemolyticus]|nr:hypothetical protein [Vibrio parahaemolyticus]
IVRNMVGNFCTSLDMEGVSITLLKADKEMLELFDAPVDTAAISGNRGEQTCKLKNNISFTG